MEYEHLNNYLKKYHAEIKGAAYLYIYVTTESINFLVLKFINIGIIC